MMVQRRSTVQQLRICRLQRERPRPLPPFAATHPKRSGFESPRRLLPFPVPPLFCFSRNARTHEIKKKRTRASSCRRSLLYAGNSGTLAAGPHRRLRPPRRRPSRLPEARAAHKKGRRRGPFLLPPTDSGGRGRQFRPRRLASAGCGPRRRSLRDHGSGMAPAGSSSCAARTCAWAVEVAVGRRPGAASVCQRCRAWIGRWRRCGSGGTAETG